MKCFILFIVIVGCNIVINADVVRIRTPGYTDGGATSKPYPTILTCLWTFNPLTTSRSYSLSFTNFALGGDDSVVRCTIKYSNMQ